MTDQTAADVQFGRQFALVRDGAVIADGIEFPDGHVAVHWTGARWPTLTPHQTMDAAIAAHSQNGAVRVVWQPTSIPQAEYGSVWPELVGWVQQAQEDGEEIDPAQLLEYMRELKQRALAPVREWMAGIRGAARQAAGQPAAIPACGSQSLPTSTGEVVRCVLATGHTGQCQNATEHPYVSWPNPSNVAWHRAARLAAGQPASDEERAGRCPVMLQGGGRCEKNAGHRPPGSDDPHTPERPAAGLAAPTNHDTETERPTAVDSARVRIINHPGVFPTADTEIAALLDEYRAEILDSAADTFDLGGNTHAGARLRDMATGAES
ncbi:hypothetical protein [Streptomyces sp. NPDC056069]|uniref:hypothetical protein n=1 Tax=Streptomyces sp. NPDC056069 TaxID=3345702 RepID=UPI0035E0E66A